MTRRDIPNLITLFRIILVFPVVWYMLQRQYDLALLLFFVAGVSDGLDGYLAKHYGWESRIGAFLDPLADKILLVICYVVLSLQGHIALWLTTLVILRDVVIVSGAFYYHYRVARLEAAPSLVSKLNTVLQIALVVLVLFDAGVMQLPAWLLTTLVALVVVSTVASGIQYVWIWSHRAARVYRGRP